MMYIREVLIFVIAKAHCLCERHVQLSTMESIYLPVLICDRRCATLAPELGILHIEWHEYI